MTWATSASGSGALKLLATNRAQRRRPGLAIGGGGPGGVQAAIQGVVEGREVQLATQPHLDGRLAESGEANSEAIEPGLKQSDLAQGQQTW